MVSRPALASRNTAKANGPSKPCSRGATRFHSGGFSNTADMGRNYGRWHHAGHDLGHSKGSPRHPPAVSAWIPLVTAIGPGGAGGAAGEGASPAGRVVVPPAAARPQPGHGHGDGGHRRLAPGDDGGGGLVAGRLLRRLRGPGHGLPGG